MIPDTPCIWYYPVWNYSVYSCTLAVFLAWKWNKNEFLPGLFFLFLYAFVEVIDLFFFTILEGMFIDVAQFGFILLAIIFFIVGMHPAWARKLVLTRKGQTSEQKTSST